MAFSDPAGGYLPVPPPPASQAEPTGGVTSPAPFTLAVLVSGTAGSRIIKAASTVTGTFTVHDVVNDQDQWAANCREDEKELTLRNLGLVGGSGFQATLTGLEIDEGQRMVSFKLDNINVSGQNWRVMGYSSNSYRAQITESSGVLTVVQKYGEIGFLSNANGKNAPAFGGCRAYWSFSVDLTP